MGASAVDRVRFITNVENPGMMVEEAVRLARASSADSPTTKSSRASTAEIKAGDTPQTNRGVRGAKVRSVSVAIVTRWSVPGSAHSRGGVRRKTAAACRALTRSRSEREVRLPTR